MGAENVLRDAVKAGDRTVISKMIMLFAAKWDAGNQVDGLLALMDLPRSILEDLLRDLPRRPDDLMIEVHLDTDAPAGVAEGRRAAATLVELVFRDHAVDVIDTIRPWLTDGGRVGLLLLGMCEIWEQVFTGADVTIAGDPRSSR